MSETPSQWLIDTCAAINYAAAVALRDQLANSSQRDNPTDAQGGRVVPRDHGDDIPLWGFGQEEAPDE